MNDQLRPCPFCGGRAEFREVDAHWMSTGWIDCSLCGASTVRVGSTGSEWKEILRDAWNRREPDPNEFPKPSLN